MADAVIGSLKVVLGLDSAAFEDGLTAAQKELAKAGRQFERVGRQIGDIGKNLSAAITLPVIGLGVAVTKTAADFESAMGRVGISTGVTGEKLKELSDLAREIGRETVFSASTAADAMDMLAKAGVSVEDILNGAARAAVDLAAAAGTELDPAAAAITDSMAQFKLQVGDLPRLVNQITGAVNESKLDFDDFQLAMGQAGGVAANLGVTFADFNAVLAGTSPLFSSGSDAGTSFKTFLQRLVPTTEGAATAIAELGLSFHDAEGNLRPMREIAQQLQDSLSGLSDQAKTSYLTEIFGTDAMRTAIALMDQGAAGLDKISVKIADTDAAEQAAKRMQGFNGQLEQMGGAFEELAIVIGESGFLNMMTGLVQAFTGLLEKLAETDPVLVRIGLVMAGVAAAIGPALIAVGAMVSAWGSLVAAFGAGGILASIGPAIGAIVPFILPVAAAVGAAVAAFLLFRDDVEPVLRKLWATMQDTLGPALGDLFSTVGDLVSGMAGAWMKFFDGPIGGAMSKFAALLTDLLGTSLIRILTAAVRLVDGALQSIGHAFSILGDLLTGDFSGAWRGIQNLVVTVVQTLGRVIDAFWPGAVDSMRKLYEGVRQWLLGKLGDVFNGVIGRVRAVGDAFFKLYDAVVGHSYIPDMVTEVGQWMAQLDDRMVTPARRATESAAQAFEDLQRRASAALEALMTDQERAEVAFRRDMKEYDALLGRGALSREQYDELTRRRTRKYDEDRTERLDPIPRIEIEPLTAIEDLNEALGVDRVRERIQAMRDDFADAFADGLDAALRGDWASVLQIVFGDAMRESMQGLGRQLFDWLGLGGSGMKSGGGFGNIGAILTSALGKLPGFANGGSILPGGSGGIDSQLVSFWKSPGEQVDIYTPGQDMGGGSRKLFFDLRGAVTTADLVSQMETMASASGGAAVMGAREAVPRDLAKTDRYTLGRR